MNNEPAANKKGPSMHLDAALSPDLSDEDGYAAMLGLLRDDETAQPRAQFSAALQSTIRARSAPPRSSRGPRFLMNGAGPAARRFLYVSATIALLLGTVLVGYWGIIRSGQNNEPAGVALQASPEPTALSSWFGHCDQYGPYAPCNGNEVVSSGFLRYDDPSDRAEEIDAVQLQRWIFPASTTFEPEQSGSPEVGFAVDFVNEGIYVATFSGEAIVVLRESSTIVREVHPEPEQTVQLGQGDSITYPIGSRTSVQNPLSTDLVVRTALFYAGDEILPDFEDGNDTEIDAVILGDAELPDLLSSLSQDGAVVHLTYSEERFGAPFPPSSSTGRFVYILGPVDQQDWGEDVPGGFFLWLQPTVG